MLQNQCFRVFNHLKQIQLNKTIRLISTGFTNKGIESHEVIRDEESNEELVKINNLFKKVNELISNGKCGQNFAVIHLFGRQFLVHNNDIISFRNAIPAEVGERIKLEKCLLVGNDYFTLIGRPLLNRDLVQIEATVIEKTMTQTYFNVKAIPRNHRYRRWRFQRFPLSLLRINQIEICHQLNRTQDIVN